MTIRSSPDERPVVDSWKSQLPDTSEAGARNNFSNYLSVCVPRIPVESESSRSGGFASLVHSSYPASEAAVPLDVSIALTYGLELLSNGAMLVAADGRPRFVNRAALTILERRDGLSLEKKGLLAERVSDTRLLLRLLQDTIQSPERGEGGESPFALPRKNALSPLIVRVMPGPALDCMTGVNNRTALVMLYDQNAVLGINVEILSRLYGLTRGEALLAANLVRGKSLEAAANELCISLHTARTHLKRIFMKTDTHRQSELLLRIFPATLAAGSSGLEASNRDS